MRGAEKAAKSLAQRANATTSAAGGAALREMLKSLTAEKSRLTEQEDTLRQHIHEVEALGAACDKFVPTLDQLLERVLASGQILAAASDRLQKCIGDGDGNGDGADASKGKKGMAGKGLHKNAKGATDTKEARATHFFWA